jgi:phosphatidylglycerophosphate synthase
MSEAAVAAILLLVGIAVFVAVLALRRLRPGLEHIDTGPASAVLSYVAAAFGILVGFIIVVLLGEASNARHAIGDEATSIGTAFDEAQLFPEAEPDLQHALICYSRAVTEQEWPELADGRSAPEADASYRELIAAYGGVDEPADRTFQPAAATNSFVQIGGISTARETRLVTAESGLRPLIWVVLIGASLLVLSLLFAVSTSARPVMQALLLGFAGVFTAVLLLLVATLNNPFQEGSGPLTPRLIEENTARMVTLAPDVAEQPCPFEESSD